MTHHFRIQMTAGDVSLNSGDARTLLDSLKAGIASGKVIELVGSPTIVLNGGHVVSVTVDPAIPGVTE